MDALLVRHVRGARAGSSRDEHVSSKEKNTLKCDLERGVTGCARHLLNSVFQVES